MTPNEYKERLLTALKTSSYKEYADIARKIMREYVNFAMDELKKLCDDNITEQTLWIWVYALRQTADKLESKNSWLCNLMDNLDKCVGVGISGTAECSKEADDNAET